MRCRRPRACHPCVADRRGAGRVRSGRPARPGQRLRWSGRTRSRSPPAKSGTTTATTAASRSAGRCGRHPARPSTPPSWPRWWRPARMRGGCAGCISPTRPNTRRRRSKPKSPPDRSAAPGPPARGATKPNATATTATAPCKPPAKKPRRRSRPVHPLHHHDRHRRHRARRRGRRRRTTRRPSPTAPPRYAEHKRPGSPPPSVWASIPTTYSPSQPADEPPDDEADDDGLGHPRWRARSERRRGHPLCGHHQPALRLVPVRGGLGRHPDRGAVGSQPAHRRTGRARPRPLAAPGLISNTGVWVQGQPGIGKSSITKRLITGLVGFGMRALIPGDIKGEYTPLVEALGGTVWRLGRGHHTLNPLDPGLAAPALAAAVGTGANNSPRTCAPAPSPCSKPCWPSPAVVQLSATGRRLLAAALDQTTAARIEPTIPDLLDALTLGADPLPQIVATDNERGYARAVRGLVNTLGLLCDGSLRGLFDPPSTITADPTTPAISLDLSALDNDADDVVAAAMLCSWAWSATLADTAGDHRNTVQVQDELWRALRAAPGLVEHSDRITRLGRHRGIVSIQVTHSLDDLDALPTDVDRAKARGMAARNAILILGGMAPQDIDRLTGIVALTDPERELVGPGPPRRPGIPATPTPAAAAT